MKVYYDVRTGEWTKDLDTSWLAPELYFEIKCSPDDNQYHEYKTDKGNVTFSSKTQEDFERQFKELDKNSKYVIRESWSVPKDIYEQGLKYFHLSED